MKNPLSIKGETREKYSRIPSDQKRLLLKRLFIDKMSIKEVRSILVEAALSMNLNYSTAKTIVFVYRKKLKLNQNRAKEE